MAYYNESKYSKDSDYWADSYDSYDSYSIATWQRRSSTGCVFALRAGLRSRKTPPVTVTQVVDFRRLDLT